MVSLCYFRTVTCGATKSSVGREFLFGAAAGYGHYRERSKDIRGKQVIWEGVNFSVNQMRYLVKVKFNSSGRIDLNGNEITVHIKSEPKHGKANSEMIKRISEFFEVPENKIHIISGLTSRKK